MTPEEEKIENIINELVELKKQDNRGKDISHYYNVAIDRLRVLSSKIEQHDRDNCE